MNPARNPYSPGAGLRPRELAGRESEIEKFGFLTERAMAGLVSKSLVMTGFRGVGKTVLLNELAATARGSDWVVAKVEADASGKSIGFRAQVAHSLNRSLRELTGSWGTGGKLRRALASFKAFSLTAIRPAPFQSASTSTPLAAGLIPARSTWTSKSWSWTSRRRHKNAASGWCSSSTNCRT